MERESLQIRRLAALLALFGGIGAAGGIWPTWQISGQPGLAAMAAAGLSAGLGVVAGLLILLKRAQANKGKLAIIFLYTGPVRIAVTFLSAGAAWLIGRWPVAPLLLWVAIFYLLLLSAETVWLAGLVRNK